MCCAKMNLTKNLNKSHCGNTVEYEVYSVAIVEHLQTHSVFNLYFKLTKESF